MTKEEAKKIFLNRGYIEVPGGTYYDANKWRDAIAVISKWLEQEPCDDLSSVTPNKREMNMEDKECEKCEHHDYCAWLHEYQDFGIVCNEYKEQSSNEEVTQ